MTYLELSRKKLFQSVSEPGLGVERSEHLPDLTLPLVIAKSFILRILVF